MLVQSFLKVLGARPNEYTQVLLLLGKGFFMGIFLGCYTIGAEVLFLQEFEQEDLSFAFFLSGILGVLSTFVFARLQSKMSFSTLTITNLFFISLFSLSIRFLFDFVNPKWFYFLAFVMMGPILAVVLLGFWGVFNRLFNLRQSKRIIGGIDTGQLLASIIAFTILTFIDVGEVLGGYANLFNIGALSLILSLGFLLIISRKYDLDEVKVDNKKSVKVVKYSTLFQDKYIFWLSIFLIISTAITLFIEYSYLVNIQERSQNHDIELGQFLAAVKLAIMLMSFIIQTFFNDRIMEMYGLKVTLIILPVVLLVVTSGAIIFHNINGAFYSLLFFLFITLSKLFGVSLKEALEVPAFKLFFLPINRSIRFDIQAKIEGVVKESSNVFFGGIILLFSAINVFNLFDFTVLLVVLLIAMIYVVFKLHHEYRNSLKLALSVKKLDETKEDISDVSTKQFLLALLKTGNDQEMVLALKLLESIDPNVFESSIEKLINHPFDDVRRYILRRVMYLKNPSLLKAIKTRVEEEQLPDIQRMAMKIEAQLQEVNEMNLSLSDEEILSLVRSELLTDRRFAARILGKHQDQKYIPYLMDLLKDANPMVRNPALISAGKVKKEECWTALIDNLSNPLYTHTSTSSIIEVGSPILPALDMLFLRVEYNPKLLRKILQIYSEVGGEEALELILKKVDHPDFRIATKAFTALASSGYQIGPYLVTKVKQLIENDVSNIAWNMAARKELGHDENTSFLRLAIKEEINASYEHIYLLLSLIYDANSIQLVKENIESKTTDGISYAIELLDVFIAEDLKGLIFPLLDDISDDERVLKLQSYFPRQDLKRDKVIKKIINRDVNNTNRWTKTSAIYCVGKMQNSLLVKDLIASLFSPDFLIVETAAWALLQLDYDIYQDNTNRLDGGIKKELDEKFIVNGMFKPEASLHLKVNIVNFFRSTELFKGINGAILSEVIDHVDVISYDSGEEVSFQEQNGISTFYIIGSGEVEVYKKEELILSLSQEEVISDLFYDKIDFKKVIIKAKKDLVLYGIRLDYFYDFVSGNAGLAKGILRVSDFKNHKKEAA